ncbi:unnamed protein product [Amoebophrya sp. A120]|nr:unnamed protein product [Amoebophrya sp. A120]|eukprot:GSA120T00019905001.1
MMPSASFSRLLALLFVAGSSLTTSLYPLQVVQVLAGGGSGSGRGRRGGRGGRGRGRGQRGSNSSRGTGPSNDAGTEAGTASDGQGDRGRARSGGRTDRSGAGTGSPRTSARDSGNPNAASAVRTSDAAARNGAPPETTGTARTGRSSTRGNGKGGGKDEKKCVRACKMAGNDIISADPFAAMKAKKKQKSSKEAAGGTSTGSAAGAGKPDKAALFAEWEEKANAGALTAEEQAKFDRMKEKKQGMEAKKAEMEAKKAEMEAEREKFFTDMERKANSGELTPEELEKFEKMKAKKQQHEAKKAEKEAEKAAFAALSDEEKRQFKEEKKQEMLANCQCAQTGIQGTMETTVSNVGLLESDAQAQEIFGASVLEALAGTLDVEQQQVNLQEVAVLEKNRLVLRLLAGSSSSTGRIKIDYEIAAADFVQEQQLREKIAQPETAPAFQLSCNSCLTEASGGGSNPKTGAAGSPTTATLQLTTTPQMSPTVPVVYQSSSSAATASSTSAGSSRSPASNDYVRASMAGAAQNYNENGSSTSGAQLLSTSTTSSAVGRMGTAASPSLMLGPVKMMGVLFSLLFGVVVLF